MCLYLKYGTEPSCKHLNKSIYVSSGQDMYHMYINSNILIYEFKDKFIGSCTMYWLRMDELIIHDKNTILSGSY